MLVRKTAYVLVNVLAVYFYLTGMFKIKKLEQHETKDANDKKYEKLIFLVIDGLRIDGAIKTEYSSKYHNNFASMNTIHNDNIKYFLTVADIPTSTSVRIKSILTGLPSNFLNGAESFSHEVVKTDSLIRKIVGKSHYFYGDDTWTSFFPELLPNSKTIPAYGKDRVYETERMLMENIVDSVDKYEYLLGHLVYLDHYGHIHTVKSDQVQFIMQEYDRMIEKIYNKMSDDTILVVISDHGVNDDGSHGGASRAEISATGVFISKKKIKVSENKVLDIIRHNYLKRVYTDGIDWIKSQQPITVIHQNDILPTVCAMMGLPIPFYSSGNFIHEFIDDASSQAKFLAQKCKVLGRNVSNHKSLEDIVHDSYKASQYICKEYAGQNHFKITIGFILAILSLILQVQYIKIANLCNIQDLAMLFTIIMVSHSVWSFIYEDLFWCITLFVNHPRLISLVLSIYSIIIGRSPKENEPRCIDARKPSQTLNKNVTLPMLFLILHAVNVFSSRLKKRFNIKTYAFQKLFTYRNLILAIKYFFPSIFSSNKLGFMLSQLSFENLANVIYPPSVLIALDLFCQLRNFNDNICFILTNMSIFVIQMNHMLSSIDYTIPFTFDTVFNMKIGGFLMLFYYLYFRFALMYKKVSEKFMFFATVHSFVNMIIGVWFYEEFLFYVVFGGRCFIVNFFIICENLIYLLN